MKNTLIIIFFTIICFFNTTKVKSQYTDCESQILPKTANVMAMAYAPNEKTCSINGTLAADQYETVHMLASVDADIASAIGVGSVVISVTDENNITRSLQVSSYYFEYDTDIAFTCTEASGCTYNFSIYTYAGGQSGPGVVSSDFAWAQGVVWVQP